LKAYIRIAETSLSTLIDIGVSVYVISEDLIKKLRLKIEANDGIKIASLGGRSKVRVIGFISNALIAMQNLCMLGLLYVIRDTESVVILGTD